MQLSDIMSDNLLTCLDMLFRSRQHASQSGHDISRVSIGVNFVSRDEVLIADDSGSYSFRERGGRVIRECRGTPSRTTEYIAAFTGVEEVRRPEIQEA